MGAPTAPQQGAIVTGCEVCGHKLVLVVLEVSLAGVRATLRLCPIHAKPWMEGGAPTVHAPVAASVAAPTLSLFESAGRW